MVIKYPKCPSKIPDGHKIYQHFPILGPPKFIQIGIFGLKINHLATLRSFTGKQKSESADDEHPANYC
jgi:hypothetical protein